LILKSRFFSWLKYLLLLSIGIALLWLTFRNENLFEIWEKLKAADPFWIIISLVIALLAFISRSIRWIMLMEPLGYKPPLTVTFYSLLVGYFANLAIPRIGEITRCGTLSNATRVPFNSLVGTVIIERIIDLMMLFISMVLVAVFEYQVLGGFLMDKVLEPIGRKFSFLKNPMVISGIFAFILLIIFILFRFRLQSENEKPFVTRIRKFIHEMIAGFKTIGKMKNTGWFIFHTLFIWIMYFLMTWVCFFSLDATSHLDMKAGIFVLVVGGLGMSAPVQGGIGAFHYIVSQGLQLFNVSSTDGIVYATLVHSTQTLFVVVLGLFSMFMLFMYNRNKSK